MNHYFIVYKPYHVITQFSPSDNKETLANYFDVPKDVYPIGRLDYDSEGLLILSNDTSLNYRLLHPSFKHERQYFAQVEGFANNEAIQKLQKGVAISIDGRKYVTQPCKASVCFTPPEVPERIPPIRFRKEIPTSWISLTLYEGKNRQVRKMTASVGLPTLRLIRYRIEKITAERMLPGDMIQLTKDNIYKMLFQ